MSGEGHVAFHSGHQECNRVVSNVGGNRYRLVVCFVETPAKYDRIDVSTV